VLFFILDLVAFMKYEYRNSLGCIEGLSSGEAGFDPAITHVESR